MGKFIQSAFITANVILVLFSFFAYLSPHIDPSKFYAFSFFGLAYPFLLLLNILFIGFWLFTKKRFALISIVTLLLGYSYPGSVFGISSSGSTSVDQKSIKVLSFNTQKVKSIRNKKGYVVEEKKVKLIDYLKMDNETDVFCTQETSYVGFNLIKAELDYKHTSRGKELGTTIFSKYPIINSGEIDLRSDNVSAAIWIDIKPSNDTIRVYNIHLKTNKISSPAERMMQDPDLQSAETWNSIRGILANYKNSTIERSKQAKLIAQHLSSSPYKSIVCGDFNDTPLSNVYNILTTGRNDTFNEKGSGIGTTYAGKIPALRIDYILVDQRLDIIDHKIHKGNYSDHYPISAKIVLP